MTLSVLGSQSALASRPAATPESRLLNVWLDLNLLGIFYPDTKPRTFMANLKKIARQLKEPLPPIHFGETASDTLKFPVGAVVIKRHPPRDTYILYSRSRALIWKLVDDPGGRIRIVRVASRK